MALRTPIVRVRSGMVKLIRAGKQVYRSGFMTEI